MATERQLLLIRDLEASIRAIEMEGIPELERTIGLICDRASTIAQNVRPMVESLKRSGDKANLSRIRAVFDKGAKIPSFLEDVKVVRGGTVPPETDLPPTGRERKARASVSVRPSGDDAEELDRELDAVEVIARCLRPFDRGTKSRILDAVKPLAHLGEMHG
jgi:hypothetical protein